MVDLVPVENDCTHPCRLAILADPETRRLAEDPWRDAPQAAAAHAWGGLRSRPAPDISEG